MTKPPDEATELSWLYSQVPAFKCVDGCTDCCGPVPFSVVEMARAQKAQPLKNVPDPRKGLHCVYAVAGACQIYMVRPFICRLFGTVDDPMLTCPHGARPAKLIPHAESRALGKRYTRLMAVGRGYAEELAGMIWQKLLG